MMMVLGWIKKLKDGFSKTQEKLSFGLHKIFGKNLKLDPESLEQLEANLYGADFGPDVSEKLLQYVKSIKKSDTPFENQLRAYMESLLKGSEGTLETSEENQVILFLGINGAGKTTTVAKVAHYIQNQLQQKVLLGSCDTFRAAADEQLKIWAQRLGIECIGSHQGADASAVAYDACSAANARHYPWTLLDTAGRLHNKGNLVEELKKMLRVVQRFNPHYPQHRWLVIDGSIGTNSLTQARLFHEAIGLTGIIITKLDGTSKGGALFGIYDQLKIPVYFIGLGEGLDDLQPFKINDYVNALLPEA